MAVEALAFGKKTMSSAAAATSARKPAMPGRRVDETASDPDKARAAAASATPSASSASSRDSSIIRRARAGSVTTGATAGAKARSVTAAAGPEAASAVSGAGSNGEAVFAGMGAGMYFGALSKWDRLLSLTQRATRRRFGIVTFGTMIPTYDNRVRLDLGKKDEFGLPILDIHIRFGPQMNLMDLDADEIIAVIDRTLRSMFDQLRADSDGVAFKSPRAIPSAPANGNGKPKR